MLMIPPNFWPYIIPAAFAVCCIVHLYDWLNPPKGYERAYGWKRLKQSHDAAREEHKCINCCQPLAADYQIDTCFTCATSEQDYSLVDLDETCDEFWTEQVNK